MNGTDDLLPKISAFCQQHALLPTGGRLIVGLSGGPDSLTLLDLLIRLAPTLNLAICAAHLNHGLRGTASDRDEETVRDICDLFGVTLHVRRSDIAAAARSGGQTLEEAGRDARYAFFTEIARNWLTQPSAGAGSSLADAGAGQPEIVRIAVGHHRDDQAETVLMNLCRGSGLQGLAGMMPQSGMVIRPLLDISRDQIDRYIQTRGLTPCLDQTNMETDATRNRLRLTVMPVIRAAIGHDASPAIARAASLLQIDADYLNREAAHQLDRMLMLMSGQVPADFDSKSSSGLAVSRLAELHPAIRSRVLRLWFQKTFGGVKDLSEKHVAAMNSLCLQNQSGHRISLPGGRSAVRDFDRLCLLGSEPGKRHSAARPDELNAEVLLQVPGVTKIPGNSGFFVTQFIENESQIVYNSQIWSFPADILAEAVVRYRRPGDRIRPYGQGCGKSLKKYLIEKKIPASVRNHLPLIARGPEVLWIPGATAVRQQPDQGTPAQQCWVSVRFQATDVTVTR